MQGNITSYRDFTNICISYFDKRFAEKKNFCPMGPSLLDCCRETEMPGKCKLKQRFNVEGQAFLYRIVAIDETWVRDFEPDLKLQSNEGRSPTPPCPKTFR